MHKETYTVATVTVKNPEIAFANVIRRGCIYNSVELGLKRQEFGFDGVIGITVSTYEDALCVQENLAFDDYTASCEAEVKAHRHVRITRTMTPSTTGEGAGALVDLITSLYGDDDGGSDNDIDFDGEGAPWAGVPAPEEFDDLPF